MNPPRASTLGVAGAVAKRSIRAAFKNPALLLPSILFPLIFLVSFAGGLSAVGSVPGFDFPTGYTAFQFVFILIQAAAFGGFFGSIGIAADFEHGFARRIFLASANRTGILLGYAAAAAVRFSFNAVLVTVAALIGGMDIDGSGIDLFGLYGLGLLVSMFTTFFAAGAFIRTKSVQSAPALQTPVFLVLFLAPVYLPLDLLNGWIKAVASVNPATAIIQAGRGFISGDPAHPALAYAICAGVIVLAAPSPCARCAAPRPACRRPRPARTGAAAAAITRQRAGRERQGVGHEGARIGSSRPHRDRAPIPLPSCCCASRSRPHVADSWSARSRLGETHGLCRRRRRRPRHGSGAADDDAPVGDLATPGPSLRPEPARRSSAARPRPRTAAAHPASRAPEPQPRDEAGPVGEVQAAAARAAQRPARPRDYRRPQALNGQAAESTARSGDGVEPSHRGVAAARRF